MSEPIEEKRDNANEEATGKAEAMIEEENEGLKEASEGCSPKNESLTASPNSKRLICRERTPVIEFELGLHCGKEIAQRGVELNIFQRLKEQPKSQASPSPPKDGENSPDKASASKRSSAFMPVIEKEATPSQSKVKDSSSAEPSLLDHILSVDLKQTFYYTNYMMQYTSTFSKPPNETKSATKTPAKQIQEQKTTPSNQSPFSMFEDYPPKSLPESRMKSLSIHNTPKLKPQGFLRKRNTSIDGIEALLSAVHKIESEEEGSETKPAPATPRLPIQKSFQESEEASNGWGEDSKKNLPNGNSETKRKPVSSPSKKDAKDKIRHCGNKFCGNKGLAKDPAMGWSRRKINNSCLWLCKSCNQAYSGNQFCNYCSQIYVDNTQYNAIVDGLTWIQCEHCKKWLHLQCEEKYGLKDIVNLIEKSSFKYFCPVCKVKYQKKTKPSSSSPSKQETDKKKSQPPSLLGKRPSSEQEDNDDPNCRRSSRLKGRSVISPFLDCYEYDGYIPRSSRRMKTDDDTSRASNEQSPALEALSADPKELLRDLQLLKDTHSANESDSEDPNEEEDNETNKQNEKVEKMKDVIENGIEKEDSKRIKEKDKEKDKDKDKDKSKKGSEGDDKSQSQSFSQNHQEKGKEEGDVELESVSSEDEKEDKGNKDSCTNSSKSKKGSSKEKKETPSTKISLPTRSSTRNGLKKEKEQQNQKAKEESNSKKNVSKVSASKTLKKLPHPSKSQPSNVKKSHKKKGVTTRSMKK